MPTYTYRCSKCGTECSRNVPVAYRDELQFCLCGGPLERVFTPTRNVHIPEGFRAGFNDIIASTPEQHAQHQAEGFVPVGRRWV